MCLIVSYEINGGFFCLVLCQGSDSDEPARDIGDQRGGLGFLVESQRIVSSPHGAKARPVCKHSAKDDLGDGASAASMVGMNQGGVANSEGLESVGEGVLLHSTYG